MYVSLAEPCIELSPLVSLLNLKKTNDEDDGSISSKDILSPVSSTPTKLDENINEQEKDGDKNLQEKTTTNDKEIKRNTETFESNRSDSF
jgi:hypothetical protein